MSHTVSRPRRLPGATRKGTNGVSTNGAAANFIFFDRGTFWVPTLTYLYFPKSARAYLFPQSVRIHYFCSGPISVGPVCPPPSNIELLVSPTSRSGVHKGGFSKGGFSNDDDNNDNDIHNNDNITHKLQNPPLLNPPFVNSRPGSSRWKRAARPRGFHGRFSRV